MSEDQEKLSSSEEKAVGILTDRVAEITCTKCGCEIDVADLDPFVRVECPDCGNIEIVPAKLGQFLLLDLLGTGGMGGVYYGRDETLGRNVAIKVMLQSLGDDAQFVENFKREAQAAARLNHPNIVQIYSFGQEKGQPYIVMELVTGEGLDKMMEPGRKLDQRLVVQVGEDIAKGLMAADEAGLIHGDIKPENILFDEKKRAKLVDFGIASFANQAAAQGSIWGTPYYIAPEKVKRQKVDSRADIYSLGATLYHALGGYPPFDGETPIEVVKARLKHPPQPLSKLRHNIDRNVERTVMRMLESEPSMRYPTYASLISDLKKVGKGLGAGTRPATIKTGRIVVPKRQSGQVAPAPAPAAPTHETHRGGRDRGTKIVIKKRGQSAAGAAIAGYRNTVVSTPEPVAAAGQPQQAQPRKKQKKVSKGRVWGILIFFILVGVGSLGAFIKIKHDERTERRREMIRLAAAISSATNAYNEASLVISNILALAAQGEVMEQQATNAYFIIKGEPLFVTKEVKKKEAEAKKAEARKKAEEAAGPPKVERRADDAPEGMPTREELDRRRAMAMKNAAGAKEEKKEEKEPEPEKKPEPESEPEKKEAPPPSPKDPVKDQAKAVLKDVDYLTGKKKQAEEMQNSVGQFRDSALRAATSQIASGLVKQIEVVGGEAKELEEGVKGIIAKAEKNLKSLLEKKDEVIAAREAEKKAKEDAEQQAKDEAERARKAEELKALVQKEMDAIVGAKTETQLLVRQCSYSQAIETLKQRFAEFQTEDAKKAGELEIERYSRLVSMKSFLITKLNSMPFSWGWLTPKQDVLGASEDGVRLKGRLVPWHEVSPGQMLRFVDHYLGHRHVKLRDQAEQAIGAAIYCLETGGGSEGATRKAVSYARKTIELRPNYEPDVKRLLPASVTEQLQ